MNEEISKEELEEYNLMVEREYQRIEKLKLFKPCKFCSKIVTRLGYNVCSSCFKSIGRWCSTSGKPINIKHLLALGEIINAEFKPSKELVAKVAELRNKTCTSDKDKNYSLAKTPLANTEYSVILLVVLYFTRERDIIESGPQFQSYIIYTMIQKGFLRDSLKRRLALYETFVEAGLLTLMFKDYTRFLEHLDGRVLKQHYDGNKTYDIYL